MLNSRVRIWTAFLAVAVLVGAASCVAGVIVAPSRYEQLDKLFAQLSSPFPNVNQAVSATGQKSDYEIFYGNGTAMEYVLAHSALTPDSDYVCVGGIALVRNLDYRIDYQRGAVVCFRPILPTESIVVGYSYAKGNTQDRTVLSVSNVALTGSGKSTMDFTYAHRNATVDKTTSLTVSSPTDLAVYGINTNTKLGAQSSITGMFYVANPEHADTPFGIPATGGTPAVAADARGDHLLVQTADLLFGKVRVQFGYQDVGQNFNGFLELRDSDAAPDATLRRLEYEKGLKRTNFLVQLSPKPGAAPGSNQVFWNTVQDMSGDFWAHGMDFGGKSFGVFAEQRGSDPTFSKMAYLAYSTESADTALQIRRQFDPNATAAQVGFLDGYQTLSGSGLERNRYGLRFGSGPTPSWVQSVRIRDNSGSISRYGFRFGGKNFNLSGYSQTVDRSFTKLAYLAESEKLQFGGLPGTYRMELGGDYKLKNGLQAILSMSEFSDDYASVTTQSVGVKSKGFDIKVNVNDVKLAFGPQTEDMGLAMLSPLRTAGLRAGQSVTLEGGMEKGLYKKLRVLTSGKLKLRLSTEQQAGQDKMASFETGIAGGTMTVEYGDVATLYQARTEFRGIKFVSNRDPKKWFHFDVAYKNRQDGSAAPFLVRTYNLDARINKRTNMTYNFYTYPEAYDGRMVSPVGGQTLQLTSSLKSGYNLVAYYRTYGYMTYPWGMSALDVGVTGKLGPKTAFGAGLGHNVSTASTGTVGGKNVWLNFDHQVSSENYFKLSSLLTLWDGPVPDLNIHDGLEFRLDYNMKTNFLSN